MHQIRLYPESNIKKKTKGKGTFLPVIGHEGPMGEKRYRATLSLNPALDGGGPEVVTNILLGAFGKTAFYSSVSPHSFTQHPLDGFT
jgi:hypothetical protein